MSKNEKKTTLLGQAKSWAAKNKLSGSQAFLRFVIFNFVENINKTSTDFVFKGGNLLWVYIKTPRATIDLDLATLKSNSHLHVKKMLEAICANSKTSDIEYSILFFKEIAIQNQLGASVAIAYKTKDGSENKFEIDIVYALILIM